MPPLPTLAASKALPAPMWGTDTVSLTILILTNVTFSSMSWVRRRAILNRLSRVTITALRIRVCSTPSQAAIAATLFPLTNVPNNFRAEQRRRDEYQWGEEEGIYCFHTSKVLGVARDCNAE